MRQVWKAEGVALDTSDKVAELRKSRKLNEQAMKNLKFQLQTKEVLAVYLVTSQLTLESSDSHRTLLVSQTVRLSVSALRVLPQ